MKRYNLKIVLAFAAIYILWGSTYFAVRIGIKTIPPFLISALRFLTASIILFVYCLVKKEKLPNFKNIFHNSICGILMLGGGTVSIAWSEQYVPSSIAAIMVTFLPFWFILLDKKEWSYYLANKIIIAGLLLGFIGVMLLTVFSNTDTFNLNKPGHAAPGIAAILLGGIAWTIGSLSSKYSNKAGSLLMNGCIQLFATSIVCFALSFITGELHSFSFEQVSKESAAALLYLIFFGSLAAYISYLYLLKKLPAVQVSTYVYVNPVIAVLLGVIFANEQMSLTEFFALFIILCGVLLVNIPKYTGLKKTG